MAEPGFTGAGLDRADHLRLDEQELAVLRLHAEARLLSLAELDPVLDDSGALAWSALAGEDEGTIFLGLEDGAPRFAPLIRTTALGQRAWGVFRLLASMSPKDAAIWAAARSLNEWHNRHVYCGVCGTETRSFRAGWGRLCPKCGMEHFPRVDPVVIMLAEHGDRVLVARGPGYPPRRYSALSGFVEPAESIEEAVARELMEEAGIAVSDVRYVASQPWPFPGSLMIACLARAGSDTLTLDTNELEDAIWVDRAGVEAALAAEPDAPFQAPPPFAIANTLLTRWIEADIEGGRR
ncbi:NAD(+) diphosphatase [Sphingosinicella sp. LHD-64]|uniref:NAD(+) diphosphatase n=1 Tax=Sphingosinicella sp. LHD-64 TaxID=3072139 RepID=UPI00280D1969|nr:NAD(+) diphosphatase [Sphingosinicella sp. LHD-64]MDQ8756187.1 NAD(+) diphosphatase [Sphingosinicella sp. LHD-64]